MRELVSEFSFYVVSVLVLFLIFYYPSAKATELIVGKNNFSLKSTSNLVITVTSLVISMLIVLTSFRVIIF